MHLHAQVGQTDCDVHDAMTKMSLSLVCFSFRFLKGSLTCTCLTSWMLKRCSTVVSNLCYSKEFLLFTVLQLWAFWKTQYFTKSKHYKTKKYLLEYKSQDLY